MTFSAYLFLIGARAVGAGLAVMVALLLCGVSDPAVLSPLVLTAASVWAVYSVVSLAGRL